jgi:hypothetical protein
MFGGIYNGVTLIGDATKIKRTAKKRRQEDHIA